MNFIHISGLEKNVNCSKNNNIIFSWNLNNSYFKDYKKKKFFHLSQIYQKNKFNIINTVSKLRKKLLSQIYKELNLLHKIDYSETEWEIILEPWLTNYLQSIYLRWIIVNEFTKIYKKFSYLKINVKKNIPFFDTLQYDTFLYNNDVYNHLLIQDILRYNNFKKNIITLNFNFELRNKFNQNNYTRIKNNFLFILYENIISKIFKIKMLINIRTKKINFFKLCFKLKILPFKGIAVFNRYKLIDILNKNSFKKKLRFNLKLKTNKKKNFENYIFNRIKKDIPRVFIENFKDIQNLHKNKLSDTKIIISDTMHKFNPIFKSWLASKKNLNKNFKIIFADHGVIYGESDIFNYNQSLSSKYFINRKSVLQNEVSLPCLFLNKYKGNFKKKILLICRDTTKYPKNLFSGPICEEMNFQTQQVNKLLNNLSNRIKDNFFIRPYMAQRGWFNLKYYEKKLGQEKIIYSNNHYEKFKNKALIKIVTYPQTAFLESVVNGPTFLLFNPKHDFGRKENKEYMNILFKNKIAFKNGKELAVHLNEIENNILSWWQQKKIQKIVNLFVNNTNIFHDDPIPAWTKNIEKLLKFKY